MKKISIFIILSAMLCMAVPRQALAQGSAKAQIERVKAQQEAQQKTMQAQQDSAKAARERQQAVYDAQNQRTQRIIWIVVAIGALFSAVVLWTKYRSVVLSIIRIFTGGYRVKGDLTTLESKKILTGAMYADQQGAYLNTLKADIGGKLYTVLGEWWGINGRDTAVETLDYLRDKAYAYYFPTVYKAFEAGSDDGRKALIVAAMTTQEDAEKAYSQTINLLESVDTLKNLNVINHTGDVEKYGVVGWDVGRLIFIARLCYDAKYISEQEAWEYIDAAYAQAQKTFNSWDELAKSYVIGRFIWKGKDADDGMDAIANDLLSKPKSPWTQVAWK
jgi:hypothetical protein